VFGLLFGVLVKVPRPSGAGRIGMTIPVFGLIP
jgi:hypothetical protein